MNEAVAHVHRDPLWAFAKEVFVHMGMPDEDAATEADVLLWANLHGVYSHGVHLMAAYSTWVDNGFVHTRPNIKVLKESAAAISIEADRAFGPIVTTFALEKVMEKARDVGVGWALIGNTIHQGAMGYYTEMALEQDMAAMTWVCYPPNMAPHGARAAGVHNSPIAIGVPGGEHPSLNLDMATSVVAGGKVQVAIDKRVSIPEGWGLDADGNPATDPNEAKTLLPAGGAKGSGLALMFECLASLMAGYPWLPRDRAYDAMQNSVVVAIDISWFTDLTGFKKNVDAVVAALKALPRADGFDEILMPGEPEKRTLEERSRDGIPLPPGTVDKLRDLSQKYGVALPEGV